MEAWVLVMGRVDIADQNQRLVGRIERLCAVTSPHAACVVALEPSVDDGEGGFSAEVRRVVMSRSFQ